MGLQKDIELGSGFSAGFHEVVSLHMDLVAEKCEVRVISYKNKAAKLAGKSHVMDKVYLIASDDFAPLLKKAYQALKLHPDFDGSTEPV